MKLLAIHEAKYMVDNSNGRFEKRMKPEAAVYELRQDGMREKEYTARGEIHHHYTWVEVSRFGDWIADGSSLFPSDSKIHAYTQKFTVNDKRFR